ncbi:MAG: hypothetical protein AAF329_05630 [Cyanobacteria bacterium P01_A01_bin.17]
MFTISSPYLPISVPPESVAGAIALTIPGTPPPVGQTVSVEPEQPQVFTGRENTSEVISPDTIEAGSIMFASPAGTVTVSRVFSNSISWSPAADVINPQPGEFTHNPYTQQLTLYTGTARPFVMGQVAQMVGAKQVTVSSDAVLTELHNLLQQIPIKECEWSLSLEGHPSGSLTIEATEANVEAIKSALAPGTELTLYGIGFRVGEQPTVKQFNAQQFPHGRYELTIPLEGKWENYVDEPFPVRSLLDPAELTSNECTQADTADLDETVPSNYSLHEIATYSGAVYDGPDLRVQTPDDAQPGETTTFTAEFTDRLRASGSIARWDYGDAIRMGSLDGGRVWDCRGAVLPIEEITTTLGRQATPQGFIPSSDLLAPTPTQALSNTPTPRPTPTGVSEEPAAELAIAWENYQLTGAFNEETPDGDSEDTLSNTTGSGAWTQRQRIIQTFEEGDEDPTLPPEGVVALRSLSLNFDQSGPTKTFSRTRKEDGVVTLTENWRYGFAFIADDAVDASGQINGVPLTHWRNIEYTVTRYLFDEDTGYALGYEKSGWRLARFKVEGDAEKETVGADADTQALYQFSQVPLTERELYLLRQHRDFYDGDVQGAESRGELVKVCLPDGSTGYRYRRNPNYAEPMFRAAVGRESVAFAFTEDPDDPTNILITGREDYSRSVLELQPGQKTIFRLGPNNPEQPGDRTPDRYTEYATTFVSQDEQYQNSFEQTGFKDFEGRPGVAERLPPLYQQETDPPESDTDTADESSANRKLYLLNTGEPVAWQGPAINIPNANTLSSAIVGAELEAYLQQLRNGDSETLAIHWNPEIRPGDKFIYEIGGQLRRRVVLGVTCKPVLLGKRKDGRLLATGVTQLQLARDIKPTVGLTEIDLPGGDGARGLEGNVITIGSKFKRGFTLGGLLPGGVQSRVKGNF